MDWFLTGEGKGPTPVNPSELEFPAWARWRALVKGLDLPDEAHHALTALPSSSTLAYKVLVTLGAPAEATMPTHALGEAQELEVRAWEALLRGLITRYGREAVRAKLAAEHRAIGLQFNPIMNAIWYSRHLSAQKPDDEERATWEKVMYQGQGAQDEDVLGWVTTPVAPSLAAQQSGKKPAQRKAKNAGSSQG